MSSDLQNAFETTATPESAYRQDAELVQKYTGAQLTQAQFDSYKDKFTLRASFGTDEEIGRHYFGYGIPSATSKMDIMDDVLNRLASAGVVFDLAEDANEGLFQKFSQSARHCLIQGSWPQVCLAYRTAPRLVAEVTEIREQMNLPRMNCVL